MSQHCEQCANPMLKGIHTCRPVSSPDQAIQQARENLDTQIHLFADEVRAWGCAVEAKIDQAIDALLAASRASLEEEIADANARIGELQHLFEQATERADRAEAALQSRASQDWQAANAELLEACKKALSEMVATVAPRDSFTDAVDLLDAVITKVEALPSIKETT